MNETLCVDPVLCVIVVVCGLFCYLLGYVIGFIFGYRKKEREGVSKEDDDLCTTYEDIVRREG